MGREQFGSERVGERRKWNAAWSGLRRAAFFSLVTAVATCNSNIFDVNLALEPSTFTADFGPATGTIPAITCSPDAPEICGTGEVLSTTTPEGFPAEVSIANGCDPATSSCFAQARARFVLPIDPPQDTSGSSFVRAVDIGYTMPANTLNFDIPAVAVYVGPAGSLTEGDAGVVFVDTIPGFAAGTTFADQRHLVLPAGSPALSVVQTAVQNQMQFVFILVATPRLEAGQPVPAGAFEIDLFPTVQVGL